MPRAGEGSDMQLGPQFNLQSNMKAKPNSQGTLFQANASQRTPASRQPRGYSPERYKAVGQALSLDVPFGHDPGTGWARARATAAVARSTIPMSHLEDPDSDYLTMHITKEGGRGGVSQGALGTYH